MYYYIILRRVSASFVAVENKLVLRILNVCFSLRYSACNVHAPYCQLWPARLYSIFQHYRIKDSIKYIYIYIYIYILNKKCVF